MRTFRDFKVWQKAHQLTLTVYTRTQEFPRDELHGLTGQLRRATASIPANIAEGCGRSSSRDFARFLQVASGSASELEYHILLARDLGLFDDAVYETLTTGVCEVKRMLTSLAQKLTADG